MAKHGVSATLEIDGESLEAQRLHINEAIDELSVLTARVTLDGELKRPLDLLGCEVKAKVFQDELPDDGRIFNGLITQAIRRVDNAGRPYLELVVSPPLYKLQKRTNLRTFLGKKVEEIIAEVMDKAGVTASFELGESYEVRENILQYRETDFDFVRRLAAEEGISFTWDHEAEQVVFFDDPAGIADQAEATLPYVAEFGFDQGFSSVRKLRREHRVVSDKVHLRQYNFEKPRNVAESKKEGKDDGEHALEVYAFPGRSVVQGELDRFAQVTLDAIQARRDQVFGASTSWRMAPGKRFKVEAHPYEKLNTEVLVTSMELIFEDKRSSFSADDDQAADPKGDAARKAGLGCRMTFEGMPTERSKYRPKSRERGAIVPGLQLATTTGASGQEIDVDDHGRVTALYPWDRDGTKDDKSSVRMRTMQLPLGGSMLHPRVGWEVLVQHDEGDADVPLVIGRLYNGVTMPPYSLPGGAVRSSIQTATTPGGGSSNELRTDDSKGKEEMFFNASKDQTVMVKNNTTESVGNNATLKIGGNQDVEITNSLTKTIGANQTVDVGGNQKNATETFQVEQAGGSYTLGIGGNRDMKVGGDHRHTVAANQTVEVGAIKTDLVVGKISEECGGNLNLTVGAGSVALTPAAIAMEAGGNQTETIGAAKMVVSFGGIGSETSGTSTKMIGGAKVDLVDADRVETAGGTYTSIAAGAQIIKCDNLVFEAEGMITLVMGASILSITPASVAILGVSAKLDGATKETAALVIDN